MVWICRAAEIVHHGASARVLRCIPDTPCQCDASGRVVIVAVAVAPRHRQRWPPVIAVADQPTGAQRGYDLVTAAASVAAHRKAARVVAQRKGQAAPAA